MRTGDQENNLCPRCGYNRGPNSKECPNCRIILAKIKSEHKNEEVEKEQEGKLSGTPKPDISEFKSAPSFSSKRNILYNLNTRAINLILFAITAIIAGILIFIYFLYLVTHE